MDLKESCTNLNKMSVEVVELCIEKNIKIAPCGDYEEDPFPFDDDIKIPTKRSRRILERAKAAREIEARKLRKRAWESMIRVDSRLGIRDPNLLERLNEFLRDVGTDPDEIDPYLDLSEPENQTPRRVYYETKHSTLGLASVSDDHVQIIESAEVKVPVGPSPSSFITSVIIEPNDEGYNTVPKIIARAKEKIPVGPSPLSFITSVKIEQEEDDDYNTVPEEILDQSSCALKMENQNDIDIPTSEKIHADRRRLQNYEGNCSLV